MKSGENLTTETKAIGMHVNLSMYKVGVVLLSFLKNDHIDEWHILCVMQLLNLRYSREQSDGKTYASKKS